MDVDGLIEERQGSTIREIVESHGWEHFRKLEKGIIEEIGGQDHLVIAPGGGAVIDGANVKVLKKNGLLIYLKGRRETLFARIFEDSSSHSRRPTLTGKGVLEEFGEMMAFRSPYYEKTADVEIDTSNLDVEGVVERILSLLSCKGDRTSASSVDPPVAPTSG